MNYGLENKTSWYNISKTLQDIITRKISYDDLSTEIKNFIEGGDLNNIDYINTRRKKVLDTLEEHLKELYKLADDGDNAIKQYIDYNVNILKKAIEDLRNSVKKKAEEGANDPPDDTPLRNLISDNLNALNDHVVKTSPPSSLFLDSNFRNIKVVANDQELSEEMLNKPFTLKDVFNGWYRTTHFCKSALYEINDYHSEIDPFVNDGGEHWQSQTKYVDIWKYDDTTKMIIKYTDYSPVCWFVSPVNYYTNYYLKLGYKATDNDHVMILVGYMKDSDGVEHTLCCTRACELGDNRVLWAFIYDFGNPTQHIIKNYTPLIRKRGNGILHFSARRINESLQFKTGEVNSNVRDDDEDYTIDWEYPSTKPNDMTPEEYYNIGVMLKRTNRVGIGAYTMETRFYIVEQYEIFDDGDIYALHQDKVYYYDTTSSSWKVRGKCSDILPNYIWLYNPRIHNFYFYYKAHQWQKIVLNGGGRI